jgi:hypothetical protein
MKEDETGVACSTHGAVRSAFRVLFGHEWVHGIEIDFMEIELEVLDWIYLAQDGDQSLVVGLGNEYSGSLRRWNIRD